MVGLENDAAALLLVSLGLIACEGAAATDQPNEFGLEEVKKVLQNTPLRMPNPYALRCLTP